MRPDIALAFAFAFAPAPEATPTIDPFSPAAAVCDCNPCSCPIGRCACPSCPCLSGQNCKPVSGPITGWNDPRRDPGAGYVWDASLTTWRPAGAGWTWSAPRQAWTREAPREVPVFRNSGTAAAVCSSGH